MEPILTATTTGFLLSLEGVTYTMQWFGELLKVTGPDTCYYLLETVRGLEQANCTLSALSVLIAN
jgi:hypothetical protein